MWNQLITEVLNLISTFIFLIYWKTEILKTMNMEITYNFSDFGEFLNFLRMLNQWYLVRYSKISQMEGYFSSQTLWLGMFDCKRLYTISVSKVVVGEKRKGTNACLFKWVILAVLAVWLVFTYELFLNSKASWTLPQCKEDIAGCCAVDFCV